MRFTRICFLNIDCPSSKHLRFGYIVKKDKISVDFKKMKPNLTVEWEPEHQSK